MNTKTTNSPTPWADLDDDGIAARFAAQSARIAELEGALARVVSAHGGGDASVNEQYQSLADARALLARLEAQ